MLSYVILIYFVYKLWMRKPIVEAYKEKTTSFEVVFVFHKINLFLLCVLCRFFALPFFDTHQEGGGEEYR